MSWRDRLGPLRWPRRARLLELVREVFWHNAGLKLLSLLAAFGIWFAVNVGEKDTEVGYQVPLELHDLPPNLMIISPRPEFVDLRVSGPRTLLNRIDRSRLSIPLNLNGVRPGPAFFRVVPETLELPRGLQIVRLTPAEITLEFARVARRQVPVHLATTGKPPNGLRVTNTKVAPEVVLVIGPAEQVERLKTVETMPLDLGAAAPGLLEEEVPLENPGEYVSYSATAVNAQVWLEEPEQTRSIGSVPVVIRNSAHRITLRPPQVRITVRGPRSAVEALELDHGAVYIDAAGLGPGRHDVTPQVDLPSDVELLLREPPKLQLQILR
jgi:hypothetical protein